MATEKSALLVKGLTGEHKDFLQRYAQNNLGTSSRTKAIIALIEQAMNMDNIHNNVDDGIKSLEQANDDNLKNAVENKKKYIDEHQQKIKQKNDEIQQAIANGNHKLATQLKRKKITINRKRIQLSLPIYDYEFLEKLAKNSDSSIQYYITVIILKHLYNDKRLLGNEIEVLKKSNYELFKIGVNVNQIAKANNAGDMIELPINKLYNEISNHIKIVKSILNDSVGIY